MILLDTNVASELMRVAPSRTVLAWYDAQADDALFLSSISVAEVTFGVLLLPDGHRRRAIEVARQSLFDEFAGRILDFDAVAALRHAELALIARRSGRGFPPPDGYIAAIAAAHGLTVASRDTAPFAAVGLTVLDPFAG